jgi:toxin-antitoxin system PIN domain toxin
MPRSTSFLPDVNVWLALASPKHVHSQRCADWLNGLRADILFCRVTQMGLLRLLTNPAVMGADVLSSRDAWSVYQDILADERVDFAPEPFALEDQWRKLTTTHRPATHLWTDAYLAAFANCAGLRLTTLDRALASLAPQSLLLIERSN